MKKVNVITANDGERKVEIRITQTQKANYGSKEIKLDMARLVDLIVIQLNGYFSFEKIKLK